MCRYSVTILLMWVKRGTAWERASVCQYRQPVKRPCTRGGVFGQVLLAFATVHGHFTQYVGQVGRFVATIFRFGPQGAGQQVRRITFEHQATARDITYQRVQVGTAAFVADPAGNADMQVKVEVAEQRLFLPGKR